MRLALLLSVCAVRTAYAAFGYSSSGSTITVDAGSSNSLIFKVNSNTCDITSLVYRGAEYQYQSTYSHIGSGLGSASVSATQSGSYIKVTCVTSTLTHYYVVKSGDSTIYMATYITAEPSIGELRYIARLNRSLLPNGIQGSYTDLTSSTVEGSDVFRASDGKTYSKFYSSVRHIDDQVHSVSGNDVVISMVIPNPTSYESSSGGPFHRDINSDRGAAYHALYFYMNSGHAQTESYRMGLHGPYAMVFSRSGLPSKSLDVSFFGSLGIQGWVGASGRGTVSGSVSGVSSSYQRVVHWYNNNAQYWAYASSSGSFTSPPMKAGTYTMKLYRDEFEVASQTVSVGAGASVTSNIASQEAAISPLWSIGELDGQPDGFQNADLQQHMHPSDVRMSTWNAKTYIVGSTALSGFPMAQIKDYNNPTTIKFTLTSAQTGAATLRIATSLSYAGGRPQATVNGWVGPVPGAPTDLNSRGFTRGTYRGFNIMYTVNIPAGTLKAGENTILINVISGSTSTGFLSPSFVYDSVQLITSGSSSGTSSTSTTRASSSSSTRPTSTTASGGAPLYGQCGGANWTGPMTCASGTCTYSNEWYSQCLP
ncbi:related to ASD-1 rhamnogalacturonase B precursor [Serendipita indica DSM 11827]|uniref:rhamnogalacturonan endolyase n=1 Tax=Serendipita indica (strain DSM 11827) TaxID=1109443 RepID=G4TU87_SERID|nr:related to ASD-1 rhamnogalacturonase B precursor [Serendipita indica DSM 11827]